MASSTACVWFIKKENVKVFTNKYPFIGSLNIDENRALDVKETEFTFNEGKVFKVVGILFEGMVLECEGKIIVVSASVFSLAFTETEFSI